MTLPPALKQSFDRLLLSCPMPDFRDTLKTFDQMWSVINDKWHKLLATPLKKAKCEALKKEIFDLYERAKAKEKEREAEKDHKTQGFMYSVTRATKLDEDVYCRLRFGRKTGSFSFEFRQNNPIRKAQKRHQ